MTSKFVAEDVTEIKPACQTCKHRSKVLPGICLAFPDGIPNAILFGQHDHTTAYEGDHGVRYAPIH